MINLRDFLKIEQVSTVYSRPQFSLFNKHILQSIAYLALQQMLIASSNIWITQFIGNLQQGFISFFWLTLYLSSLLIPYIPGAFAWIESAKAKVTAYVEFVNHFVEVHTGQIVEWTNSSKHSSKTSLLSGEVSQTIQEYLDYVYYLFSAGLNVVFNLFAIAILIEPLLFLSFGLGISLACLILYVQKQPKKRLALKAQQGRIRWISILLKAWDNVLLQNTYNLRIWKQKAKIRGERLIGKAVKLEGFSQRISVTMALVLFGPTFVLICYTTVSHIDNHTLMAMMAVTLPRMFQMLSYSYDVLFYLADLPSQKNRLATIMKIVNPADLPKEDKAISELQKRIHWDKIAVKSHCIPQLLIAEGLLGELPPTGRITLQGENGCGKTSLLLLLKLLNGSTAFYLPAKHDLSFQMSKEKLSSGQLARKTLHELMQHLDAKVILLDEWDANLDKVNSEMISNLINDLAAKACVIESRHRKDLQP